MGIILQAGFYFIFVDLYYFDCIFEVLNKRSDMNGQKKTVKQKEKKKKQTFFFPSLYAKHKWAAPSEIVPVRVFVDSKAQISLCSYAVWSGLSLSSY